jgi:hypothetical protein
MKDRKRRPKGGEWEPQISFETLDRCPKINPKRHTNKSYKNSSHQESRDPKDVPQIARNPTQKTELELETERARNGSQQHKLRATDSPQVKNLKPNFAETVLFSTEKQLL